MYVLFSLLHNAPFNNYKCREHAIVYLTYDNHRAGIALECALFALFKVFFLWLLFQSVFIMGLLHGSFTVLYTKSFT